MIDGNINLDFERRKKIVLCGKSFIACEAFKYLVDLFTLKNCSQEIFVCPTASDKGEDTWQPSLEKCARELGIPSIGSLGAANLHENDVVISLEYDKLIRERELNGAKAYNIHFSNLPYYRGCLTSVWPIRNLEPLAGVTLHFITPGVDDGPIIDQELFAIPRFWRSFDLYRAYNFYGYELFKKNIVNILNGTVSARGQDQNLATLYKRNTVDFSQIEIADFSRPAERISAYIKSLIFPPYQLPEYQGKRIENCDVIIVDRSKKHSIGELVYFDKRRAVVACLDRYVRIIFESELEN